jgi:RIO-like serine/threonine protein kinase
VITPDSVAPIAQAVKAFAEGHGLELKEAFRQLRVGIRRQERAAERLTPSPEALRILEALESYRQEHGFSPTLRELGKRADRAWVTANYHLEILRELGLATWVPTKSRTYLVTPAGLQVLAGRKAA